MFCDYISDLYRGIPLWIYVVVLCASVFGCILFLVIRDKNRGEKLLVRLLLYVYVILMLCSTVIFREPRTISHHGFDPFWHYEAFRQGRLQLLPELIMNILAFIPRGFVFCLTFRRINWWRAIIAGLGLSVGIEFLQWVFKRGCTDIDDVIHNTLGCFIGYGLYMVISRCYKRSNSSNSGMLLV